MLTRAQSHLWEKRPQPAQALVAPTMESLLSRYTFVSFYREKQLPICVSLEPLFWIVPAATGGQLIFSLWDCMKPGRLTK
jgi:hypothetical protein